MTDITDCYFTSLTAPTAFFAIRLGTAAWDDATSADQTKALQMATYKIDSLDYQGYKLLSTQARQFPRKYVPTDSINPWGNLMSEDPYGYIYDSSTPPQFVLDACDATVFIPMSQPGVRSLNLSVSAAVGLFEAKRQLGELG